MWCVTCAWLLRVLCRLGLGVGIHFPSLYSFMMEWLKVFNLDIDVLSPECFGSMMPVAMTWHAKQVPRGNHTKCRPLVASDRRIQEP